MRRLTFTPTQGYVWGYRKALFCLAAALVVAGLALPTPAHAQRALNSRFDRAVSLTISGDNTFDSVLAQAARVGEITVIVEGTPLHPQLGSEVKKQLAARVSLKDILETLAAACDYSTAYSGNVCLMRKHYASLADIPTVSYAETALAFHNAARLLALFSPRKATGPASPSVRRRSDVLDFVNSLDTSQIGEARRGIPLSHLTADQKSQAQQIASNIYLGQLFELANIDSVLQRASDLTLTIGKTTVGKEKREVSVFGYEVPDANGKPVFTPLDLAALDKAVSSADKVTVPRSNDTGGDSEKAEPETALPSFTILGAAAVSLPPGKYRYTVDPEFAAKPLMVVGNRFSDPDVQFDALAAAFALRIRSYPDGHKAIGSQPFQVPRYASALIPEIRSFLPNSLLQIHDSRRTAQAATEKLERLVQPKMPQTEEGKAAHLSFGQLTEEEKRALAVAIAARALNSLNDVPSLPGWLLDFSKVDSISARTTVDPTGGRHMVVGFHLLEADGKHKTEAAAISLPLRDLPSPLPEEPTDPPRHRIP